MKYRRLTESNDYSFGNGQYDYIDGAQAVAYAIRSKILLFYGEWWEDLAQGIPMFQSILGQSNSTTILNSFKMLLEKRINELDQVKTVDNITVSIDKESRILTAEVRCTVDSGESVNVEVNI